MKQTISKCITKMLSCVAVVSVVVGMVMFTGCKSNSSADLVVYGKIFTAEGGQMAEYRKMILTFICFNL
jgi:hypothetical protein